MRVKGAANWESFMALYRGRFQAYGHPKYGMVVTKWPRKRGKKRTQAQIDNNDTFKQVVAWCREPMAADVEVAQYVTKGTGFLPRDLIEAACYGNVVIAYMNDGRVLYGRRTVSADAQALLDTVSSDLGSMLIRTSSGWVGLAPSTAGLQLVAQGPGLPPAWGEPVRTVAFPLIGRPGNSQKFSITMTQDGVLLANCGLPQAYIPTLPTAAQVFTLNTISGATVTAHGTISISASGVVTWPTFADVPMAAGDTVQLVNQAAQDATFADACLSLQLRVK